MPSFLTREQIYRLLTKELPENVYPLGRPQDYVATADLDAVAQCIESAYGLMETIYNNFFPVDAEEQLIDWEKKLFNETPAGDLTVAQRRANILAFLRTQNDISYWNIITALLAYVTPGLVVELRQRSGQNDPITGTLKGELADDVWAPGWVAGDPAPAGVTVTDEIRNSYTALLAVRTQAYMVDVVLWTTDTISTEFQALLNSLLTKIEPARCDHTITVIPERLNAGAIEIDRFNAEYYQAAFVDESSSTGYRAPAAYYFGFEEDDYSLPFADVLEDNATVVTPASPYFGFEEDFAAFGFGDSTDSTIGGYWPVASTGGGYWFFVPTT